MSDYTPEEHRIQDFRDERDYWRAAAMYLADCNAASLESLPKSAGKKHRKRFESLCFVSLAIVEYCWCGDMAPTRKEAVADRLKEALDGEAGT